MHFNIKRLLALFLVILTLMPGAAFADSFSAVVDVDSMSVYQSDDLFEPLGTLAKHTIVTILNAEDGVAKLSYKGRVGYASIADMKSVADVATVATVTRDARVYAAASKAAKSVKIERGEKVNLLNTQGKWAAIERGGYLGFILADALTTGNLSDDDQNDESVISCNFQAAVSAKKLTVYASASAKAPKLGSMERGTVVTVHSYSKEWAYIDLDGHYGYVQHAGLTKDLPAATVAPTTAPEEDDDDGVIDCNFQAAVSIAKLTVYSSASTKADKLGTMKRGTIVTVLSYNKTWALIDLDGHKGYVKHSGLTKDLPDPTATPKPTPTPAPDYSGATLSNEETIFRFLINECGFNTAAACGVLANIRAESNFRPDALNSLGCYGICQWYKGRRTRLNNFCEENGYDSSTLEGQLWYLKYELQEHYKGTWNYLRGVDNTAQGAYDAGYYWCYHFEVPENRTSNSQKRGNSAMDTYWPKYSK